MTLTKAELADLLFEKVGLNKREAKDMVEAFFEEIRGALERGERLKLSGFGSYPLRTKPTAPGPNPKAGGGVPNHPPPCRPLPPQQEAEGHGGESTAGSKPAGKLSSRRFPRSATSPSVR